MTDRLYTESMNSGANRLIGSLTGRDMHHGAEAEIPVGRPGRRLSIYPGQMGYELQDELEDLSRQGSQCLLRSAIPGAGHAAPRRTPDSPGGRA